MENSAVLRSDDRTPTSALDSPTAGDKPGHSALNGHISQIPGLSPTISTPSEDQGQSRRTRYLDSDSDYVKIAKQGGHKELLWHEESILSKPSTYKPPDWFGTLSDDASNPSVINSGERKTSAAFQPLEPPFGTDNMSAWERENIINVDKEKNNDADDGPTEKVTSSRRRSACHFKRRMPHKNPSPVDMSKLLSFGYAEPNKPDQ